MESAYHRRTATSTDSLYILPKVQECLAQMQRGQRSAETFGTAPAHLLEGGEAPRLPLLDEGEAAGGQEVADHLHRPVGGGAAPQRTPTGLRAIPLQPRSLGLEPLSRTDPWTTFLSDPLPLTSCTPHDHHAANGGDSGLRLGVAGLT